MEKEFVPYSLAVRMKKLGFDEPCFAAYSDVDNLFIYWDDLASTDELFTSQTYCEGFDYECLAPTFSQAFRWFREKYNLHQSIIKYSSSKIHWCQIEMISDKKDRSGEYEVIYATSLSNFTKYRDAELACLEKLIEIVESKSE